MKGKDWLVSLFVGMVLAAAVITTIASRIAGG